MALSRDYSENVRKLKVIAEEMYQRRINKSQRLENNASHHEEPVNLDIVEDSAKKVNVGSSSTAVVPANNPYSTYEGVLNDIKEEHRPVDLSKVENGTPVNNNNQIDTTNIMPKTHLSNGKVDDAIYLTGINTSIVFGHNISKLIEHYTDGLADLYADHMKDVVKICQDQKLNPVDAEKQSLEKLKIPAEGKKYSVSQLEGMLNERLDYCITEDYEKFYSSLTQDQKDNLFKQVKSEYFNRHRWAIESVLGDGDQNELNKKAKCQVAIERAKKYKEELCKALGVDKSKLVVNVNNLSDARFSEDVEKLLAIPENQEKVTKIMTRFLIDETVAAKVVSKQNEKTNNINLDQYKNNQNNQGNPSNPENQGNDDSAQKYSNIAFKGKFASTDSERKAVANAYKWYKEMSNDVRDPKSNKGDSKGSMGREGR